EDLAALQKMPDQSRLERYNSIKADEEEFVWEFAKEYDQLTDSEREEVRAKFRLARLLLAVSFYAEDALPRALADDFVEAELQAVVDFERYKRFEVLTEDEIESKIRRMDGEVYELVTEYTSTQIANMDELMDDPDVQSDVMRTLLDRYQERREKIRRGFFLYVEIYGFKHMVESIEAAVQAVSESADERETIQEELREEIESQSESLESNIRRQQRTLEAKLQSVEYKIEDRTVDPDQFEAEIERLESKGESLTDEQNALLEEFAQRIDRTSKLEERLATKIDQLEQVKAETREQARESAREETTTVVEEELDALREQRKQLHAEIETLEREREGIEVARDRLTNRQQELESQVDKVQESLGAGESSLPGNAISTSMARLLEMDYVGRFDTTMYDARKIHTPDGSFDVPPNYWDDRSEHLNDRTRLDQLLAEDGVPERYPLNRRARYAITVSGLLGLSRQREMVIEAAIQSNLEAFARNGFDATPGDLDDLLAVVNDAVYKAQQNDYHYLLAVVSPTGWTDRVIRQVEGGDVARSRYSRHLSLVLVDLQSGELYYDDSDEIAEKNSNLFSIPIIKERVDEAVEVVQDNYVADAGVDNVLLEEVIEEHGFDAREVKAAFNRLESAGEGDQLHVEEYGLALDFSG
ncbi:MAG: hypothetical protein V5A56_15085, partial [Halolamina sp.]